VRFSVGATADVAAPAFDGVSAVSWDLERKTNDCTDALEPRFVFDLALAAADDDGGRGNLTLVVFQTAGPSIAGGGVAVLTRAMPAPGAAARVKLPVGDAVGRVRVAALARDLTGKTSNGGSHEVCVHTTAPPFFHGCGVAPAHGRAQVRDGLAGVLVMLTIAARARRRRAS
jgi:hypothetical protein